MMRRIIRGFLFISLAGAAIVFAAKRGWLRDVFAPVIGPITIRSDLKQYGETRQPDLQRVIDETENAIAVWNAAHNELQYELRRVGRDPQADDTYCDWSSTIKRFEADLSQRKEELTDLFIAFRKLELAPSKSDLADYEDRSRTVAAHSVAMRKKLEEALRTWKSGGARPPGPSAVIERIERGDVNGGGEKIGSPSLATSAPREGESVLPGDRDVGASPTGTAAPTENASHPPKPPVRRGRDGDAPKATADELVDSGTAKRKNGDYRGSKSDLDSAIRIEPNNSRAYQARGVTLICLEKLDEAIADFGSAIRLNPEYALAFANRGVAFQKMGDVDRAKADYATAEKLGFDTRGALKSAGK